MTLSKFLTEENLNSQADLARRLGVSPQSLKQFLERNSATFKNLMREHFPMWDIEYTEQGWDFSYPQSYSGTYLHRITKQVLLTENDVLNENPPVFSFVAALPDSIAFAFDTPAEDYIIFTQADGHLEYGRFPTSQLSRLAESMRVWAAGDYP